MTNMAQGWVGALRWEGDGEEGVLHLLDQTLLPGRVEILPLKTAAAVFEAIRKLRVRGAPAIGVAAAYGVVLGCQPGAKGDNTSLQKQVIEVASMLAESRPTAVNLFWALDRMKRVAAGEQRLTSAELIERLLHEAQAIEAEDRQMCAAIGRYGAALLPDQGGVLTHCNTGGLATAGDGTALAAIIAAHAMGKAITVYADETRPLLQGARLTAWELMQRKIPVTLICDSMAGWVMKKGRVQAAIVGADRITARGDAANKIGTYSVAVLAKAHGIPFFVAAPSSTFDLTMLDGTEIPIEERAAEEITHPLGTQFAPVGCHVFNPAFDVTPADLITGIVTERGVISPVTEGNVRRMLGQ
jgi:methylthioribose-1-phosphate isomerase